MKNLNFIILLISIYSLVCQETYPLNENDENPFGDNEELWGNGGPIDFGDDNNIPWGNDGPIDDDGFIPWGNGGPIDFDDDKNSPWGNDGPIDDGYIPWGKNGPIDFGNEYIP